MQMIDMSSLALPPKAGRFSSYKTVDSKLSLKDIIYHQNNQNYIQNKSSLALGEHDTSFMANTIEFYAAFLGRLAKAGYVFKTVEQTMQKDGLGDGTHAMIRHDVDGDLPAALRCAEIEHRLGIAASYYLLHTGPYYGSFQHGVFRRNEACADIYLAIQELGHEIGLHTDALWIYQQWGMDGIEGLIEELNWLRAIGLRIVGTAPHNSPEAYGGVSNSELFYGRYHYRSKITCKQKPADLDHAKIEGIPVRSIHEGPLGLLYEADMIWEKPVGVDWISIVGHDRNARYISLDSQALITRVAKENIELTALLNITLSMTHERCLETLLPTSVPHVLYLSVHPEYYGRRQFSMAWP